MAIIGPIVIAAATAAVGTFFQSRSQNYTAREQQRLAQIGVANDLFKTISTNMDTRLYQMRLVYWGVSSDDVTAEEATTRWQTYRKTLYSWNESLNTNLALLSRYFGKRLADMFENEIQPGYVDLGAQLSAMYNHEDQRTDENYQKFETSADQLNNLNRKLIDKMIGKIQRETIGTFGSDFE